MAEHIFEEAARGFEHLFHHGHHAASEPRQAQAAGRAPIQPPDSSPVNLAAATAAALREETPMSLASIDADLRNDLTAGISYGKELFARLEAAAPGIISTVDTVANSTVGKLAETLAGSVLPPEVEPVLVNLVGDFVKRYGQPAAVAPAAPQQPAAPAPTA